MGIILQEFILMLVISTGSLSAESRIFMTVKVDRSAVLPCNWKTILDNLATDQSPHIEWRTFSETVFERLGEEQFQGEGYEGRIDVPEDELKKGNCSLVLKDVKLGDAAVYESHLLVKRTKRSLQSKRVFIQSVELSVDDTPEEINSAQDKLNSRARLLLLHSSGVIHFPSPIITFTILTIILLFMQCFIDPL
uniref:Immunoglobulin V-set domain-containing protein n=1 Tax=Astyanax mexicanus TaxID=7994 RepID=A0A8B9JYA8_ASTMX